jgi:hypothetical protein
MASSVQIVNVEAEAAVEAVAEVVGGTPEGGHLGSLRHGVLSKHRYFTRKMPVQMTSSNVCRQFYLYH